jgi:hypothetical protein
VKLDPGAHVFMHSGLPLNLGVTTRGRGSGSIGTTEVCGESFDDGTCGYRFLTGGVNNNVPLVLMLPE